MTQDSIIVAIASWFSSLSTSTQLAIPLALLLVIWCGYHFYLHPLAQFPGPISARLGFPTWQFKQAYLRQYVWSLEELHDKYGTCVRIGPNHLSMTSCEAVDTIYAHGAKFNKSNFYHSFQVYAKHPSIFSDIDPKSHADRRRAVSAAYSMTSLVGLEKYIDPLIDSLLQQLRLRVNSNKFNDEKEKNSNAKTSLDMSTWMHYFAMDAVGELAFGKSFGFVEKGNDNDNFLLGVSNLSHWGSMAGWVPSLSGPLRSLLRLQSGEPSGSVVGSVTKPLIDARYEALSMSSGEILDEDDEPRMDLLAKFIKSKDPKTSKVFTPQQVLTTAISVVGAGSDTTSVALTAILGYLVRHPDIYTAVQQEIDEAFETGQLSKPVNYAMGVKLALTQACIKETLRLHPPISMSLPRIVPSGGIVIDKHFLSAGVEVSVSPYVFHRTEQAYGKDARQYNPYRWLDINDDQRRLLEKHNLTFGGGSRQCIGKNISLMELSKVLPALLRSFTFSIPAASSPRTSPISDTLRRDCDGSWSRTSPWTCESTWFLDAKNLILDMTERAIDDEDDE